MYYYNNTIQWETLMNPHFNSFDEINYDELHYIAKHPAYLGYIDWLKFGKFTLIRQNFPLSKFPVVR